MASVHFHSELTPFTGGTETVEVDAGDYRELVKRLDQRFPGLARELEEGIAVAIDGEIIHDPFLEPIGSRSEVFFMHRISGG